MNNICNEASDHAPPRPPQKRFAGTMEMLNAKDRASFFLITSESKTSPRAVEASTTRVQSAGALLMHGLCWPQILRTSDLLVEERNFPPVTADGL